MKKLHPLLSVLFLISLGFGQKEYDYNKIVKRDGKYFVKFSDEIVYGKIFTKIDSQKVFLGWIKKGLKDDKWTEWYDNGNKKLSLNYRKGLMNGQYTKWNENGNKSVEGNFVNGDGTNILEKRKENDTPTNGRDGTWKNYTENGKVERISEWKDGMLLSDKSYNKDGTLFSEGLYGEKYFPPLPEGFVLEDKSLNHIGTYKEYYKTGEVLKEVELNWVKEVTVGVGKLFDKNGNIGFSLNFNSLGQRHGLTKRFMNKSLEKSYKYNNGFLLEIITYNVDGTVISKIDCTVEDCSKVE